MSSKKCKDYQVGYAKPPVETRFQKGTSGNPNGRPKKDPPALDPGKVLQEMDNEEIVLAVDGKPKSMPTAEIHFRQLFTKAIKGDLTTARLVANMAAKYFGPEAEGPGETRFIVVPDGKNKRARKANQG